MSLARSLAPADCEADKPENQQHHRHDPKEVQRKSESGEDQNDEKCKQQKHHAPPFPGPTSAPGAMNGSHAVRAANPDFPFDRVALWVCVPQENEEEREVSENKDTGPEAGVKGIVEDVKGKAKEAAGAITGKDELRREGRAQQDKAEAERDVAVKEAEAEKARAEAEAHEAEQRSHQS
jgi:uncharacterized protein YjbJ (UPF0337 family)